MIDIESSGRVGKFSIANTGEWSEIFVVIAKDNYLISCIAKDVINYGATKAHLRIEQQLISKQRGQKFYRGSI